MMRITQNGMYNTIRAQLANHTRKLMKAEEINSSQQKINRISDDPLDGGRLLDIGGSMERAIQYIRNGQRSNEVAMREDNLLGSLGGILIDAKSLLLKESNQPTSTATTREATRLQIAELTTRLLQIGNASLEGNYIFSGYQTTTAPYSSAAATITPVGGAPTDATVQLVDPMKATGREFSVQFTSPTTYDIIDPSTGTPFLSNQTFDPTSETLSFEGVTLRFPTAPSAGDEFSVNVTMPGEVYYGDDGVQMVEVENGKMVPMNTTGTQIFTFNDPTLGNVDIFGILNALNEALCNQDDVSRQAAFNDLSQKIDAAQVHVSTERARIGAQTQSITDSITRMEDIYGSLDELRSNFQDVDVVEAALEVTRCQDAYTASLSASAMLIQTSLWDFLR